MPLTNDFGIKANSHPGFISGKYYTSSLVVSPATTTFSNGSIYYTYFFAPIQANFNRISFNTSSSFMIPQEARIAIYAVNNGLPTKLLFNLGIISLSTSGNKEVIFPFSLIPGWYAIAIQFTATINVVSPNLNLSYLLGQSIISLSALPSGLRASFNYGDFPNSAPINNISEMPTPLFWLRAS